MEIGSFLDIKHGVLSLAGKYDEAGKSYYFG